MLVGLDMHPAAEVFLGEFGGLLVDVHGPGRTAARTPFELDPSLCAGEEDRFRDWGVEIGASLYPLGELDHGRYFLGMDDRGLTTSWRPGWPASARAARGSSRRARERCRHRSRPTASATDRLNLPFHRSSYRCKWRPAGPQK